MQNKLRNNLISAIKLNLSSIAIGILFVFLFTSQAACIDYSELYDKLDIRWDLTPNKVLTKYGPVENIFWFGRIEATDVTAIPSGKVEVLWFFSQYAFVNPGPNAVVEPFHVEKQNSGYFLFRIILQNTTVSEAESDWTKQLQEPYYVLVAGKPTEIGTFDGLKTVVIDPINWYFSDSYNIIYED